MLLAGVVLTASATRGCSWTCGVSKFPSPVVGVLALGASLVVSVVGMAAVDAVRFLLLL